MPINKQVIQREIELIKNTLAKIENMQIDENELENEDIQDLLAFRIQQCIESCIDIASHIIANENLGIADSARTSFDVLSKNNIITKSVAEKVGQAVGMRNIIVHQYDDIDISKLLAVYKTDKQDIKEFLSQILRYIES